jgi:hypothetical protein
MPDSTRKGSHFFQNRSGVLPVMLRYETEQARNGRSCSLASGKSVSQQVIILLRHFEQPHDFVTDRIFVCHYHNSSEPGTGTGVVDSDSLFF